MAKKRLILSFISHIQVFHEKGHQYPFVPTSYDAFSSKLKYFDFSASLLSIYAQKTGQKGAFLSSFLLIQVFNEWGLLFVHLRIPHVGLSTKLKHLDNCTHLLPINTQKITQKGLILSFSYTYRFFLRKSNNMHMSRLLRIE